MGQAAERICILYVSLIEIYNVASDLKTKKAISDHKVLETAEVTDKVVARMHEKRVKAVAEGRDVKVIRTAVAWDDARRENPRKKRRAFQKIMRKVMKHVKTPDSQQQAQVDDEVDKLFTQRERKPEARTKSGLVITGGR
ncbi:hypothetical protein LCGC14_1660310 [marine sediment metagenome]|uniref:Uncharacterized protein n=1 Tax=marine sediment metagenome TaxID=412755 RepID=A0A0F9IGQ6_9ZZZZ